MADRSSADRLRHATGRVGELLATVGTRLGPHAGARFALVVGILTGISATVSLTGLLPGEDPHPFLGMNFSVYYAAADAAVTGGSIYEVTAPGYPGEDFYLYPPVVVVPFVPFLLVPRLVGFVAFTLLSIAAGVAVALLIVRYLRREGVAVGRVDAVLVVAFVVASTHAVPSVYFGNVNLLLGAASVAGFLALERRRTDAGAEGLSSARRLESLAGLVFGVIALVKAFPALLGLWLLRERSLAATATWAATGAGGLLAGVVLFGRETTVTYFRGVLLPRGDTEAFVGGLDPGAQFYVTLRRPLSQVIWWLAPDADPAWLTVTTVVVGGGILAAFYVRLDGRQDRLAAMLATAAVAVTVVASYRLYLVLLYFPAIALLYTFEGPGYRPFVAGAVLFSLSARPDDVVAWTAAAPWAVESVLAPLAAGFSLPLLGVLCMLAGCLRAKVAEGESEPVSSSTPEA